MKETENQTSKEIEQVNKENVLVDLKKLVIFIVGVINATMEIKSKT